MCVIQYHAFLMKHATVFLYFAVYLLSADVLRLARLTCVPYKCLAVYHFIHTADGKFMLVSIGLIVSVCTTD